MKNLQVSLLISLLFGSLVAHAGEPSVSVTVGGEITPGVYGEIQIGNTPPPLVYAQPVIIAPGPHHEAGRPIYLHVPPGHAKRWSRYCSRYNACNRPVYFVRSAEYEPEYGKDKQHGNGRKNEGDHGRGHGRGKEGRD